MPDPAPVTISPSVPCRFVIACTIMYIIAISIIMYYNVY